MAEYQQDFTFTPRHLGTLRFNDAEILTIEEVLDEETGEPVHRIYNISLENSITGSKSTELVSFIDPQ